MNMIRMRLHVAEDGAVTGRAPNEVPPGEHDAEIAVETAPHGRPHAKPRKFDDLPTHDVGPWPEGLSLRREDIYGDDGR